MCVCVRSARQAMGFEHQIADQMERCELVTSMRYARQVMGFEHHVCSEGNGV